MTFLKRSQLMQNGDRFIFGLLLGIVIGMLWHIIMWLEHIAALLESV